MRSKFEKWLESKIELKNQRYGTGVTRLKYFENKIKIKI
jgi:hypothetical protein